MSVPILRRDRDFGCEEVSCRLVGASIRGKSSGCFGSLENSFRTLGCLYLLACDFILMTLDLCQMWRPDNMRYKPTV